MGSISDKIKSLASDGDTQSQPTTGGGVSAAIGEEYRDLTDAFDIEISKFKIYGIVVCCVVMLIISWVLDRPTSSYVITTFSGLILVFMFTGSLSTIKKHSKKESTAPMLTTEKKTTPSTIEPPTIET
jgi:hypothetical protein